MINKQPFLLDIPAHNQHQNDIFNPGNASYDVWVKKEALLAFSESFDKVENYDRPEIWQAYMDTVSYSYSNTKKECRRQYFNATGENCAITGCQRVSVKHGKYIRKLPKVKK